MNRGLCLLAIAQLLLSSAPASAAGINLGWNDCSSGASYALTETFACNTNSGTHTIVGSFIAPAGMVAVTGIDATIDLATPFESPLPAWWDLGAAGCRGHSLTGSFDFTGGPSTCTDYWQGAAIGGIAYSAGFGGYNRARIRLGCALVVGDPLIRPIAEGTEVYAFKLTIDNAKSAGAGACAGCDVGACLVLQHISVTQVPGTPAGDFRLTNPATAQHVIWQGWSSPFFQCPAVTPTKAQTWGEIKALYR